MDSPVVASVDGQTFTTEKARRMSKRMFYAGFAFLPLLWLTNVWLFWPEFTSGRDPVIAKHTRRSAIGFLISTALFLPWFIFYLSAGAKYMSEDTYSKLDITRFAVRDYLGI